MSPVGIVVVVVVVVVSASVDVSVTGTVVLVVAAADSGSSSEPQAAPNKSAPVTAASRKADLVMVVVSPIKPTDVSVGRSTLGRVGR